MKSFLNAKIAVTALLLLSVPATLLAQSEKETKGAEQIIITRKGAADGKTVIEINGDKVTVNGKEVDKNNGDVTVRRHKLRDTEALARARVYAPGNFNFDFNMDDDRISLFSEDENRAMLGVSTKDHDADKVKGAEVTSVSKESAAEKAGLKAGDIITRIGNEKIEDAGDVSAVIKEHKPGDKVTVTILRNGKEQKLSAELTKWKGVNIQGIRALPRMFEGEGWEPAPPVPGMPPAPGMGGTIYYGGQPRLGMSVQDTEDGKGVKVLNVADDSNAEKAGLKEGDIITHVGDKAVNSADEVSRLVRENREKASFMMKVQRSGKTHNIEVRTPRRLKTTNL